MTVLFVLHTETDSSSAEVTECGWCGPNACYYIYSDGTLEICGSGVMYDYNGFTHSPWYDHRDNITKIVIGDGITQLGASAFIGLKHVTELTIPITVNSVVSDSFPAFAGCYKIEKIHFTLGKGGYGYDYAAYEVSNCWYQNTPWYESRNYLKEIDFADGVTHIGNDAFRELNITSVELPQSVTLLGSHCFFNCEKLTELTLPVSLNSYGDIVCPAFKGCLAVNKVTFTRGNGVPFDYSSWWGGQLCSGLAPWNMNSNITKKITIADDVVSLGKYMFYQCNIGELTIPVNVNCGDSKAFSGTYDFLEKVTITKGTGRGCDYNSNTQNYNPWNCAPRLLTLTVEDGVTHFGDYAFYHCNAETVVLPDSLVSLGKYTFAGCTMKYLTVPISLNTVWLDGYPAFDGVNELVKVNITPGTGYGIDYAGYEGSNCWYQKTPWYQSNGTVREINFADGIRHIGSDAFRNLIINTLVIPDTVESLGCHTFFQCKFLYSLTIPVSLDSTCSAKYPAFEGVSYLEKLRLTPGTDGVGHDYIGVVPFWNYPYEWVRTITIDSGIRYLGVNTFTVYSFADQDGNIMKTNAANLSGHTFYGGGSVKHIVDNSSDIASKNPAVDCIAEVDRNGLNALEDLNSVVGFDSKYGLVPIFGSGSVTGSDDFLSV